MELAGRVVSFFINGKFTAQHTTGVQRVAGQLVRALDRRLALQGGAARYELLVPPGVALPGLQHIGTGVVAGDRRLAVWEQVHLPRAARNGMLLNLAGSAPAWCGPQACFMHDAAVFDHPDAYSLTFRSWYRFLFRRLARTARSLFTVSAFSQERLASMLGVPASRVHLVPNGADHLASTEPDLSIVTAHGLDQHPFLLAVGSASPTKNMDALAQAWARLHRPEARLVVVGGGNPVVFASRGIVQGPGVLQFGHIADAQLKALYQRAAGLVFPSLYEGFGLPPLEAMACGCPVAVSNVASMPEVCGDAALYFDPTSVPAMIDAMRALLDDAALRDSLRERGHRRAALFRWDDSAAALLRGLEATA